SEEILGEVLWSLVPRDRIVLATKVQGDADPYQRGLSRRAILRQVDLSLNRLRTDYIDLYQIHRFDPSTPIDETMQAHDDLIRWGKVRYIGASAMFAWQLAKMQQIARDNGWTPFISMQNQINLIYREEEGEMIALCHDKGVGLIPWSPVARGLARAACRRGDGADGNRCLHPDALRRDRGCRPRRHRRSAGGRGGDGTLDGTGGAGLGAAKAGGGRAHRRLFPPRTVH
ncbi:MAG: aldo/keto reductase, partial [Tabrizicola sp.]